MAEKVFLGVIEMSTRSTIAFTGKYHVYWDGFDQKNVHLAIETDDRDELIIRIPATAWAELSKPDIEHSQFLNKTPDECREILRMKVKTRITNWENRGRNLKDISTLLGLTKYGPIDSPIEEQISTAMKALGLKE